MQGWILELCYDPGIYSETVFLDNTYPESIFNQGNAGAYW